MSPAGTTEREIDRSSRFVFFFRPCRDFWMISAIDPALKRWAIVTPPMKPPEPDAAFEISLRPPAFTEFTGQIKVRGRLELMVEAAKKRGDVLEHILLSGPSGLGKTTLAFIIANAMNVNIKNTSGPVIEKAGELAGLL